MTSDITDIFPLGNMRPVKIEEEMRASYVDYAMSVNVSRAIPDVRDGLKPVQRRILYAMRSWADGRLRVQEERTRRRRGHGQVPPARRLARLRRAGPPGAGPFTMRYPLVDGQGNFGSVDNDPPAAMRYTEARLSRDRSRNPRRHRQEHGRLPAELRRHARAAEGPARAPAEPAAQRRFRHRRRPGDEHPAAQPRRDLRRHRAAHRQPRRDHGRADRHRQGPDFPTGGIIFRYETVRKPATDGQGPTSEQRDAIRRPTPTARGRIVIRARVHVEEQAKGRTQIIVTELPFQVNKAALVGASPSWSSAKQDRRHQRPARRVRPPRHAHRDRAEPRRPGAAGAQRALQAHRHADGLRRQHAGAGRRQPRDDPPQEVARGLHRLPARGHPPPQRVRPREGARPRAHPRRPAQGDRTSWTRSSGRSAARHPPTQRRRSCRRRPSTSASARRRPCSTCSSAAWPRSSARRSRTSTASCIQQINYLEDLLANPRKIDFLIKEDADEVKKKYGDERRTQIIDQEPEDFTEEDLIPHQEIVITLTNRGYIKRLPLETYRPQRRGGGGITGMGRARRTRCAACWSPTRTTACCSSPTAAASSRCGPTRCPMSPAQARGEPIMQLIQLDQQERITGVVRVPAGDGTRLHGHGDAHGRGQEDAAQEVRQRAARRPDRDGPGEGRRAGLRQAGGG